MTTSSTKLDKEQQDVVGSRKDAICIAGPGSGKTRVLASKAEELTKEGKDVICLTFTRAAAQEIRDRIPGILAGTIHSLAHSVVGWKETHEDLLARYISKGRDKYEWVLVDEVQDLTADQLQVVLSLVGKHLFAVGDPFQSIYGYGGALGWEVIPLLKGRGCAEFRLHSNYRSNQRIVDRLNSIYSRGLRSSGVNDNGILSILCRSNDAVNSVGSILKDNKIGHRLRFGSNDYGPKREVNRGSSKIQVSTIHAAKGLEFSKVVLYGWVPRLTGFYGHGYSSSNTSSFMDGQATRTAEETNVYYVAVSRAAVGYVGVMTSEDLIPALEGFIPDLYSLRFREDGSPVSNY